VKHPVLGVAAGLVIVGAAGTGVGALTGNLWQSPVRMVPVSGQVRLRPSTRTIAVSVFDAHVTVRGTSGRRVTYSGWLPMVRQGARTRQGADGEWTMDVRGATMQLGLRQLPADRDGLAFTWRSPQLTLTVPRGLAVTITTTNGAVRLSGIDGASSVSTTNSPVDVSGVDGPLHVRTSNGQVSVRGVMGPVTVQDQNGGLVLDAIRGAVQAATVNSPVSLRNLWGAVHVTDANGSITGSSPIGGLWSLQTSNAPIRLQVPHTVSAALQATTSAGSIGGSVDWAPEGPNAARCRLGTGLHRVSLETSNASIWVDGAH
jgi:hypothetical protein